MRKNSSSNTDFIACSTGLVSRLSRSEVLEELTGSNHMYLVHEFHSRWQPPPPPPSAGFDFRWNVKTLDVRVLLDNFGSFTQHMNSEVLEASEVLEFSRAVSICSV